MPAHDSGRQTVYCTCLPLSPYGRGLSVCARRLAPFLLWSALSLPGIAADPAIPSGQLTSPASQPATGSQKAKMSTTESLQRQLSAREDSLTSVELLGNENSLLTLYRQAEGPDVKGAVLVLHDTDQHPDWPLTVRPVREGLAEHGWHTLSIAMSAPKLGEPPERTLPPKNQNGALISAAVPADGATANGSDATEPTAAASTAVVDTTYPAQNGTADEVHLPDDLQRVAIGYQWLGTLEAEKTAIVGIGSRGKVALQSWLELQLDAGRVALVLINADLSAERLKQMNEQTERLSEAAILDVFDPLDELSSKLAAGRLRSFERMNAARYFQMKISGLANKTGRLDRRLTRTIRGWLEKRAFHQ